MDQETFEREYGREAAWLRAEFGQGFDLRAPAFPRAGVVFASPHSGAHYPDAFVAGSGLGREALRRNEDALVDALFSCAPASGAPLLSARFPRSFVDVNRAGDDLPPEWQEPGAVPAVREGSAAYRARLGLGVVPLLISEREAIYSHPPSAAAVHARLDCLYRPYHSALKAQLDGALRRWDGALLVDCHSMPGSAVGRRGTPRADIVLGDAHGRAAREGTTALLEELFKARGYRVARNHPYAGGFATLHYGRPDRGVEAVQVEINRDLYLDPVTLGPSRGYARLSRDIAGIVGELVAARAPGLREAAE